ncbi:MAG: hypothetical protein J6Y82_00700 [Bacteroidales bacterium]|nr:hypothetical protein [Bacteroidales bacterium]
MATFSLSDKADASHSKSFTRQLLILGCATCSWFFGLIPAIAAHNTLLTLPLAVKSAFFLIVIFESVTSQFLIIPPFSAPASASLAPAIMPMKTEASVRVFVNVYSTSKFLTLIFSIVPKLSPTSPNLSPILISSLVFIVPVMQQ